MESDTTFIYTGKTKTCSRWGADVFEFCQALIAMASDSGLGAARV